MDIAIEALRQGTLDYINMDPEVISLTPTIKTKLQSGSFVWEDGPPRVPQTFKLIALAFAVRPTIVSDGVDHVIDYHLLGAWDCLMESGDHWVGNDGRQFSVIAMDEGHGYQKKGLVQCHG